MNLNGESMKKTVALTLFALLTTARAGAAAPPHARSDQAGPAWSSGAYVYDGVGNIAAIGTQLNANGDGLYTNYVYDSMLRLIRADTARASSSAPGSPRIETYDYDVYGNMMHGTSKDGTGIDYSVDSGNHLAGTSIQFDAAGNVVLYNGESYSYDAAGMMVAKDHDITWHDRYIYTADDERVGSRIGDTWTWTFRDAKGSALRQYQSSNSNPSANWTWSEDYVYGPRGMVAAQRPAPEGIRHFHLDHLGTPRLITNATGVAIAQHDYSPFGIELTSSRQESGREEPKKFTGHERDLVPDALSNPERYLDYMHARYYGPGSGRFLSVDPVVNVKRSSTRPQGWNRYAYVLNNPMDAIDPDGRDVWMQNWQLADQTLLFSQIEQKTGLKLAVQNGKMVEVGQTVDANGKIIGSQTARDDLRTAMAPGRTFILSETSSSKEMGNRTGAKIELNMALIGQVNTGQNDPATFDASMIMFHELLGHGLNGLADPRDFMLKSNPMAKGEVVTYDNKIRGELGLPERRQYRTEIRTNGTCYIPFANGPVDIPKPEH